jgi:uncharacterized protein
VLVWIGATTGDAPIEEFAVKAFEKWKVGRAAKDDGLVFFLFTEDRKMRIEVGYGLEDKVTDLLASRIIREVVAPRLQANDRDGAVTAGATALLSTIDAGGGENAAAASPAREAPPYRAARPLTAAQKVLFAVVGLGLLLLLVTNPSLAVWLLLNMLSSGGGGRGGGFSGGGGGGGWSGGGGRSGGGGASGSW